jgi:large subunit ribosomal protein L22
MVTSILKKAPISHRKMSIAAGLVRGMKVGEAVLQLKFANLKACHILHGVVKSAIANAENNMNIDPDTLVVDIIDVGPATRLKRFSPRARGRSNIVRKHYSNIRVVLKTLQGN